jgi:hypothetical protein
MRAASRITSAHFRGRRSEVPDPVGNDQVCTAVGNWKGIHRRQQNERPSSKCVVAACRAAAASSIGRDMSVPTTFHPPRASGNGIAACAASDVDSQRMRVRFNQRCAA